MQRLLFLFLIAFLLFDGTNAQIFRGRLSSSFYTFERFETPGKSTTYMRGYQQLQLNIIEKQFSLHTSLNLENGYSSALDSDPRLRFYNLYFEGKNLFNMATIKVGRQPVFKGIASGIFDGASLKVKYSDYSLETYYGGAVPAYQKLEIADNWSDNGIFVAGLSGLFFDQLKISAGYISKKFAVMDYFATRLDEQFNPVTFLIRKNSGNYQYLYGDFNYQPSGTELNVNGSYEYDMNLFETGKADISIEYEAIDDFTVLAYGLYREPRVNYNSIFSVFDYGNMMEGELGLMYELNENFTFTGKFGMVEYKDENSSRFQLMANTKYGSLGYRAGTGYSGELSSLFLNLGYTFMEGFVTPTAAVAFTSYKLSKDDAENTLTTILAGCNVRPWKAFSFDIQGQYMDNKIYKNDMRLLLKLNYWFNTTL